MNDPARKELLASIVPVAHAVFTSNTYLVLQKATLRGLGIGLLPLRPMYNDVLAGKLRVLLPDHPVPDRPLFAVYAPGKQPVRKVKVFIDFIQQWFREHPMVELPPAQKPAAVKSARAIAASARHGSKQANG